MVLWRLTASRAGAKASGKGKIPTSDRGGEP